MQFQRTDHLVFIGRGDHKVVEVATSNHCIQNRRLDRDTPGRWNLGDDLNTQILCRTLNTYLHHLIEGIDDTRQKADGNLVILGASGEWSRGQNQCCKQHREQCFLWHFQPP